MRSEEELDAKLSALQHRVEHESIPLSEEKKAIAQMKKLEGQRLKVSCPPLYRAQTHRMCSLSATCCGKCQQLLHQQKQ